MTYDNRTAYGNFKSSTFFGARQSSISPARKENRLTTRLSFVDRITKLLGGLKHRKTVLVMSRSYEIEVLPSRKPVVARPDLVRNKHAFMESATHAALMLSGSAGRYASLNKGIHEKLMHTSSNLG